MLESTLGYSIRKKKDTFSITKKHGMIKAESTTPWLR